MDKPRTLAALTRYLKERPYLKVIMPYGPKADKPLPRKFVSYSRSYGIRFENEDGKETFLPIRSQELTCHDNGFEVAQAEEKPIAYFYQDAPFVPS